MNWTLFFLSRFVAASFFTSFSKSTVNDRARMGLLQELHKAMNIRKSVLFPLFLCCASFFVGYNWRLIQEGILHTELWHVPLLTRAAWRTERVATAVTKRMFELASELEDSSTLRRLGAPTSRQVPPFADQKATRASSSTFSLPSARTTSADPSKSVASREQRQSQLSTASPSAVKVNRLATEGVSSPPGRSALILFMQEHVGSGFFAGKNRHNPFVGLRCPYSNCEVTTNSTLFGEASLIIMPSLWGGDCCSSNINGSVSCRSGGGRVTFLPRPRSDQAYMFCNRESVSRTTPPLSCFQALDAIINYTWTYKLDSDVQNTYGGFRAMGAVKQVKRNYSAEKSKDVLWYVGNCRGTASAKIRWNLAQNLSKYIGLDIFGKCSGRSDGCHASNTSCVRSVFEQYRYYLALENSACKDYVTEKLFRALLFGSIPIVRGLSKGDYARLAPPHSFIHLDDYKTEADLASHLRYLSSNSTAYNEYHAWRARYEIQTPDKGLCKLCELGSRLPASNSFRITAWWNASRDCSE